MRLNDALSPAWVGRPVTLVVQVRDLPHGDARGTVLLAEVERVETAGARVPHPIRLHAGGADWPAGSRWRLTAVLHPPRALANRHGFDAEAWLWAQGIRAQGRVAGRPLGLADGNDAVSRLDRLRERLARRIERTLGSGRGAALIVALSVGDQHRLDAGEGKNSSALMQ